MKKISLSFLDKSLSYINYLKDILTSMLVAPGAELISLGLISLHCGQLNKVAFSLGLHQELVS
jgi:hypothetical protein